MKVAVLGLGEAGSLLASDLALFGDDVAGYDPAIAAAIEGVNLCESAKAAVAGRDLVLAVTHASHAAPLLDSVTDDLSPGAIYADLCTGSPGLKERLAAAAAGRSARFVDVALMAPVPGRGLGVPALVGNGDQAAIVVQPGEQAVAYAVRLAVLADGALPVGEAERLAARRERQTGAVRAERGAMQIRARRHEPSTALRA